MIKALGFVGVLSVIGFGFPTEVVIQPDSKVWVEGGSTVRDYTCRATTVDGVIESGSGELSLAAIGTAVASMQIRIAVAQLDCGNGTMDGHMRKALKSPEHGTIEFRMDRYVVTGVDAGIANLELYGTLSIAGADRPVLIKAAATQESDGTLRVQGSHPLTMSEWGVKPPSLMLGTMKVRDDVVVGFDIRLRQQ